MQFESGYLGERARIKVKALHPQLRNLRKKRPLDENPQALLQRCRLHLLNPSMASHPTLKRLNLLLQHQARAVKQSHHHVSSHSMSTRECQANSNLASVTTAPGPPAPGPKLAHPPQSGDLVSGMQDLALDREEETNK
jgi:hypothetical protein